MMKKAFSADNIFDVLKAMTIKYRLPMLSGIVFGLLAHMFALTNKLVNADEVGSLFAKGALYGSGRWGLKLFEIIFPSYSMPWLWGLLSIVFISVAACITIRIFEIKNPVTQLLLAGMMTSFPSVTGTMCFMFTTTEYFFVLMFAVLAVLLAVGKWKYRWLASGVLLVLTTGTYQAYILVAASYFVIWLIRELIVSDKSAKAIFAEALKYVALLLVSLAVYYGISEIMLRISGETFVDYAFSENSLLRRLIMAYTSFAGIILKGYFGFVSNGLSRVVHVLSVLILAFACVLYLVREKDILKKLLFLLCIVLLPLSINGIYLIADIGVIYSVVLFSFASVYVFAAVMCETVLEEKHAALGELVKLGLVLIILVNVVFANKIYLKEYLMYENAQSFYTGVLTQVRSCEGYDENSRIAIIGTAENIRRVEEIDTSDFSPAPVSFDLVNIYTKEQFMKYYLGFEGSFSDEAEMREIAQSEEFASMPCYPYYGSVQKIGDCVTVKLSDMN